MFTPVVPMVGFFRRGPALYLGSSRCARPLPLRLCRPCRTSQSLHSPRLRQTCFEREGSVGGHPPLPTSLRIQLRRVERLRRDRQTNGCDAGFSHELSASLITWSKTRHHQPFLHPRN